MKNTHLVLALALAVSGAVSTHAQLSNAAGAAGSGNNSSTAGSGTATGQGNPTAPRPSSTNPPPPVVNPTPAPSRSPAEPPSQLPPPPTVQTGAGGNVTAPGTTTGVATGVGAEGMRTAPDTTAAGRTGPGTRPLPSGTSADTMTPGVADALSHAPTNATPSATVDSVATLNQIQHASFGGRGELTTRLGSNLDASQRSLTQLRDRLSGTGARPNAEFQRALNEVSARERTLRSSLQTTTRAPNESSWNAAQTALARDYQAYVEAVANAEAAAQGSVSGTGTRTP